MNNDFIFRDLFRIMADDKRINVWHFSVYMSLLNRWLANGRINPVSISRSEIMRQTHIRSIVTYHKCIRQLRDFGYIIYEPSYNPFIGSYIRLLIFAK